jgi:starch synthase
LSIVKILVATSEAVPFAKTGGLADVCGALPVALAGLGHQAAVILPAYRQAKYCGMPLRPLGIEFIVPIGSKTVAGRLLESHLPNSDVPVYLVEQDQYFDRDELYALGREDYKDNCERFVFFCRAVMEAIRLLDLKVDVLHANDWQTGLLPAYLKIEYRSLPRYREIASLFTIHNMAFQGKFWHWDMLLTGLDWKHFNWHEMEFYGQLNLLKTGLVFADSINTVSPRYAQEIQTPIFGCGLEGVLQYRRSVLSGILNGIDEKEWNPATDAYLPVSYSAETVERGKPAAKEALQQDLDLPRRAGVPLIGMVGRLTEQKGVDMVAEVIPEWMERSDVQWAILGKGDPKYHRIFERFSRLYPERLAVRLEFSDVLAHRIEAGADLFLMPSRFEPCGLNQMYSLKYGTVPVVRETGGLADTIVDATPDNLAAGTANGFSFREDNVQALGETLRRAYDACHRPEVSRQLIATGMRQDWSWTRSAVQYASLYQQTVQRMKQAGGGDGAV